MPYHILVASLTLMALFRTLMNNCYKEEHTISMHVIGQDMGEEIYSHTLFNIIENRATHNMTN